MLSAFVLSLQWRYCLWEGLLWIQVESYWKCSQDHSECQSADRQTEGALWTSGNYKLFFLVGVSYAGCLVPPLMWGKYGDSISFSVLKVRRGTVPNCSHFCGASVTCCWRQSRDLIATEPQQYICDSLSLPGSALIIAIWLRGWRMEESWWDLFVVESSACIGYLSRNGLQELTSQVLEVRQKRSCVSSLVSPWLIRTVLWRIGCLLSAAWKTIHLISLIERWSNLEKGCLRTKL